MRCFERCSISAFTRVTFASLLICSASHADEESVPPKAPNRMESITIASEQRVDRASDEEDAETPELTTTQPSPLSSDQEWSNEKLRDVLSGKAGPPEGWPRNPGPITTTGTVLERDAQGNTFARPVMETMNVDSLGDLTPAQRHAICVRQFNAQISSLKSQLSQETPKVQEEQLLAQLKSAYSARFRIDTVFQDIRVREIERRARKLRNELDARDEAEESWVKAMLTLAEMKADGIDTTAGDFPQPAPYDDSRLRRNAYNQPSFGNANQSNFMLQNTTRPSTRFSTSSQNQRVDDRSVYTNSGRGDQTSANRVDPRRELDSQYRNGDQSSSLPRPSPANTTGSR